MAAEIRCACVCVCVCVQVCVCMRVCAMCARGWGAPVDPDQPPLLPREAETAVLPTVEGLALTSLRPPSAPSCLLTLEVEATQTEGYCLVHYPLNYFRNKHVKPRSFYPRVKHPSSPWREVQEGQSRWWAGSSAPNPQGVLGRCPGVLFPLPPAPRSPLGGRHRAGARLCRRLPSPGSVSRALRGRLGMHLLTLKTSCWLEET